MRHVLLIAVLAAAACDSGTNLQGDAPDAREDGDGPVRDEGGDAADAEGDMASDEATPEAIEDAPIEEDGPDCWAYPCEPYGTELGNTLRDLSFEPVNDAAIALAGDDGELDLHDIYQQNGEHGGTTRALLVYVIGLWCPPCVTDADVLLGLYEALHPLGVEMLGLVVDGHTPGVLATRDEARSFADEHGWQFPAVRGALAASYWPPDRTVDTPIPLYLFLDARNMRLYGRYPGAERTKMARQVSEELIEDPRWASEGVREISFDCTPGSGTETEPNAMGESPEDGTTLPFTLSGVLCPPTAADGILVDTDDTDLGTLTAGTVVEAEIATAGSHARPLLSLLGPDVPLGTYGPLAPDNNPTSRQWVIAATGRYFLSAREGRDYYRDPVVARPRTPEDQCCEGGPDYDYQVTIRPFALAPTDGAVTPGSSASGTLADGDIDVRTLDVTAGTTYTIHMVADDATALDPYLVLYDPDTSGVLAYNDDEDSMNRNSLITYTTAATKTIWVVAEYYITILGSAEPSYVISVE